MLKCAAVRGGVSMSELVSRTGHDERKRERGFQTQGGFLVILPVSFKIGAGNSHVAQ